jgi:hypothetical protein
LSEPQPSSSTWRLVTGIDGAAGAAACVIRWKGFVETSGCGGGGGATGGAGAGADGAGDAASEDCDIILKKGLRLSVSAVGGLDVTICGVEAAAAGGGVGFLSGSRSTTWLSSMVGVEA